MGFTTQTGIVTSARLTTMPTDPANVPKTNSTMETAAKHALRINTSRDNVRVPPDCCGRITSIVLTVVRQITQTEDVPVRKTCFTTTGIVTIALRTTMPMAHANVQKIICITTNNTTDVSIVLRTTMRTEVVRVPSRTCTTTRSKTDVLTALRIVMRTAVVNAMKECSTMTGNVTTAQQTTTLMALANVPKASFGW